MIKSKSDTMADTVHTFMKERQAQYDEAHPDAPSNSLFTNEEIGIVSTMGKITLIITAFLKASNKRSDAEKKEFCKFLYEGRQLLKIIAPPTPRDEMHCPICRVDDVREEDPCPHGDIVAAAILLMAKLRIEPTLDMRDDETPDLDGEDGTIPEAS